MENTLSLYSCISDMLHFTFISTLKQLNVSQQFPARVLLLSCNSCQKLRKIAAGAELTHKKTDVSSESFQ